MRANADAPRAENLRALLVAAFARRDGVRATTTAYRLVDGGADGLPGIAVDCFGAWSAASVYDDGAEELVGPLGEALVPALARGLYVKRHTKGDQRRREREDVAPALPVAGEPGPAELVVEENGMRFGVWLGDGLSTGLFTDQRDNRARVRAFCRGERMLNLFAYTCSFTVAAALGGAIETVSVDLSNRALERGRENLARNGIAPDGHRFIREDALTYLTRASRRGERFGVVVLDPPSFGTSGGKTFSVVRDYARAAELSLSVLAPRGRLLAVTNHRKTSSGELEELVRHAARRSGREVAELAAFGPPSDYPSCRIGEPIAKSVLAVVI